MGCAQELIFVRCILAIVSCIIYQDKISEKVKNFLHHRECRVHWEKSQISLPSRTDVLTVRTVCTLWLSTRYWTLPHTTINLNLN